MSDRVFVTLVGSDGEAVLTWRCLEQMCGKWAGAYRSSGVEAGGLVLIFLRHRPELYGAFFGAMLEGLVPSFMPCTSPRQDPKIYWSSHAELLRRIKPAGIVADRETFEEMNHAGLDLGEAKLIALEAVEHSGQVEFRGNDDESSICLLQHSSGTTGLKKGVALSFGAIVEQVESYSRQIGITPDDAVVSWLPLYHDMGLIACCILPAYVGVPITHIDPFHWLVKPRILFDRMGPEACSGGAFTWLPNFAFDHLASICGRQAADFDLASVRAFINCSEPCKPHSFARFQQAFAGAGVSWDQLQCCYAMAESVFAVTQTKIGEPPHVIQVAPRSLDRGRTPEPVREGGLELVECGRPIPGIEVRVLDEQGAPVPSGMVGEIGLTGHFMFDGYNRDPERTAQRIVDGVYRTNDVGFIDPEGRLYVLGRLDDLIIINGRNLYAHEVEAVVSKIDGVKPGRAVAMAEFSERVGSETLIVAAEHRNGDSREPAEIRREIQSEIHSVFGVVPHRIEIVPEGSLIKTTSGKMSRKENLARFSAAKGK